MRIVAIAVAALILTGCAELFLNHFGDVSPDAENVSVGNVILPENAPTISQGYNPRPETDSEVLPGAGHEGIDIYAKKGTPVIAAAAGTITDSFFEPFYGNQVIIEHGRDMNDNPVSSIYLHLDKRFVVKGDRVARGQQIGTLGSRGILAGYPHLHFEIRAGSSLESRNPHSYWVDGAAIVTCFDGNRTYPDKPFMTTYPLPCR